MTDRGAARVVPIAAAALRRAHRRRDAYRAHPAGQTRARDLRHGPARSDTGSRSNPGAMGPTFLREPVSHPLGGRRSSARMAPSSAPADSWGTVR